MAVGDPDAMRALADTLVEKASGVRSTAKSIKKRWDSKGFSGPYERALKSSLEQHLAGFATAADGFDSVAATLRRSAREVDAQILAEKRAREAAERARVEAAARAQAEAAKEGRWA